MTDYYSLLGPLVLGSRFRKISERMLAEIGEVYKSLEIEFEPGWFHVLYLLNEQEEMSITQISETLGVAHPSVIQVAKVMEKNEIVEAFPGREDKRKRMLKLSAKGQNLVDQILPVWDKIKTSIWEVLDEGEHSKFMFEAMNELESNLDKMSLAERVKKK